MKHLSDREQAYLMLAIFILPALIVWFNNGIPTDKTSLGLVGASIFSGILAFMKELLGAAK